MMKAKSDMNVRLSPRAGLRGGYGSGVRGLWACWLAALVGLSACSPRGSEPGEAANVSTGAQAEPQAADPGAAGRTTRANQTHAGAAQPVAAMPAATSAGGEQAMTSDSIQRDSKGVIINAKLIPDSEWQKRLSPEQFHVTREKGTERAYTGKYWDTKDAGVYRCSNCGEVLFTSKEKFDSGCGWPSFYQAASKARIIERPDNDHGMTRTEVVCANCDAHLGHVFEDGPRDKTGLRYCINSASIEIEKDQKNDQKDATKDAPKTDVKPGK